MNDMITIIVPVYKIKEEYLRQCIESLINQGREDYKIILVDDGSPDGCGKICDSYADDNKIITVIHQENQGVSVARNNGIKNTTTKWFTFVDADDWVESDYIDTLYKAIRDDASHADIVMYEYSREFKKDNSIETLQSKSGYLTKEAIEVVRRGTFYKLIAEGRPNPYTVIALWSKVYRTAFITENNVWFIPEAKKGQDRLFNADALNTTSKIYYLHKVLYRYRCWEDSRTNRYDPNVPNLTAIELKSLQSIIEKHRLGDDANEYLKCRICTRLYACMRLYYFHSQNKMRIREKIKAVKGLAADEPYCSAFKTVNMKLLSPQERVFVSCMKKRLYVIVYFLVCAKSFKTKQHLS